MTSPYFTTNDQDISQLEGLYIKERNPPAQVKGVALNGVGVVGECVRGPVNQVVEITSKARFLEVFGGRDHTALGTGGAVVGKVWQSLLNKPFGRLFVARAAAAAAAAASFTIETTAGGGGTTVALVSAANPGSWGNNVGIRVHAATDGNANHWNLTVRYLGNTVTYKNLDTTTGNDNLADVIGDDLGNLVVVTKLGNGRPVNHAASTDGTDADGYVLLGATVSGFTSVAGSDGTIAATDYTGTGDGMELLNATKGVAVAYVAEYMASGIKDKAELLVAAVSDRIWLVGPDAHTTSAGDAATDAASQRSDRLVYCFNHAYTRDPDTGNELLCRPEAWMASILSQTAVDVHPGDWDNRKYLAGVTRLYNEGLARQDYINLKAAGVCALEKDEGFGFVSGVTSSLTSGREEITRRRSVDYIQLSLASALKYNVYKKNTASQRAVIAGLVSGFLNQAKKDEFVVEQFSVDTESLNSPLTRAAGVEKVLLRVKLIGHILHLVLETEIGTGVTITEIAA